MGKSLYQPVSAWVEEFDQMEGGGDDWDLANPHTVYTQTLGHYTDTVRIYTKDNITPAYGIHAVYLA